MPHLEEVRVAARPIDGFEGVVDARTMRAFRKEAREARALLKDRVVWNVNSTAVGGGVAEMLAPLLAYTRGAGVDARWLVLQGDPDFFHVTKRLHHALHGARGDGRPLDAEAREVFDRVSHENAVELSARVRAGDVVILHDPQTAGLAAPLLQVGAHVVWRCHIGHDRRNEEVDAAWTFLAPYLRDVPLLVFTREAYVPDELDRERVVIVQPSIDAFATKNRDLTDVQVRSILVHTGLVEGPLPDPCDLHFTRNDGTRGRVERHADLVRLGRPPSWDAPMVVQVSRWDPLKDMLGVLCGFARACDGQPPAEAELVLAGPNVHAVADDPEGPAVFREVLDAWFALPHAIRHKVQLAMLPTHDVEENAVIVNALQRHATVVVQKSLHEGFGLTVTEAMWKARPVIASRVGGIVDQVQHGRTGLLLDDPADLDAFAGALRELLLDPERARALGLAGREAVRARFLGVRHLREYAALVRRLLAPVTA